jgi:hypothetical protein
MQQDLEQTLKELFGESFSRLTQFQGDQMKKITDRLQTMAREAVKEDLARLQLEINELRARVARLETERAESAAESVKSSF